jgi:hypothetical protein
LEFRQRSSPVCFGSRLCDTSITWQIPGIIFVLPLAGHYRRTGEASCAFTLALIVTTCISVLVPAIGVDGTLHASDFHKLEPQGPAIPCGTRHCRAQAACIRQVCFGLWGDVPEFPRGSGALVGSGASRRPVQAPLATARASVAAALTQTLVRPAAEPPAVAEVQAAVADSKV